MQRIIFSTIFGLISFAATAQKTPEDTAQKHKDLDALTIASNQRLNKQPVSIGKVAINPMDLPQSVVTINSSVIENQQAQKLSDVIKNVNGVYLGTTRGAVQETFYARGYRLGSDNLYKNGARVNSGVMPEVSSLEKVEILKGSSAILYGNVAPGGIINMVTKQPKAYFGGDISVRTGSYGLVKPAFDIYGPISSGVAYRLNGTYESANSYRDEVHSKKVYFNPSMLFNLGAKTTLLVQGDYMYQNFTPDFGIGSLDNTIISNLPRNTFLGTSWQYNKLNQTTATATLTHKMSKAWQVAANASYQLYNRDYYSTERVQAAANGDWTRPLNRTESKEDYVVGSVDFTGNVKTGKVRHTILAGVDADRYFTTSFAFNNPSTYDKINILDPSKFTPRTDIPDAEKFRKLYTPQYRLGVYAQDLVSISEKVKFLAGIRYSVQDAQAPTTTYLANDSIVMGSGQKNHAFSPRAGLVYRPTQTVSLFASYSNSFSINSGTTITNEILDPSIIDQYEAGIKTELIHGKLSVNVTGYSIVNSNLAQTARFLADGVTPNNNTAFKELTGQTTSKGVEIDLKATPLQGLNLMAGYSYNDYRFTKVEEGKGNYIQGDRLVNTPATTANGSVWYTLNKTRLKGLKLGAMAVYIGDRFAGWNNTQGQSQAYNRTIAVKGFTTVDLSAGYSFQKVTALVKLSNVFDTYNYYVHENYSINPIPPRQVVGTLSYRF